MSHSPAARSTEKISHIKMTSFFLDNLPDLSICTPYLVLVMATILSATSTSVRTFRFNLHKSKIYLSIFSWSRPKQNCYNKIRLKRTYLQQIFLIEGTHVQVVIPQNIPKFQELFPLNYHPWFFLERVSAI